MPDAVPAAPPGATPRERGRVPRWRHRICARPIALCWVLGTLVLSLPTTFALHGAGAFFPGLLSDGWTLLSLALGYACLAGLGFFLGVMAFSLPVVRVCRWINGGPFAVGDRVIVLTGPCAGRATTVSELYRGQGGGLLPRVELGPGAREKFRDIFDDTALLRAPAETPAQSSATRP